MRESFHVRAENTKKRKREKKRKKANGDLRLSRRERRLASSREFVELSRNGGPRERERERDEDDHREQRVAPAGGRVESG